MTYLSLVYVAVCDCMGAGADALIHGELGSGVGCLRLP